MVQLPCIGLHFLVLS